MASYLFDWLIVVVLACLAMFWWNTMGLRQQAYEAAKRHCQGLGLQLLDQSVMLKRVRFRRNRAGGLSLLRVFVFEFASIGDERYCGEVQLLGRALIAVNVDLHRI